MEVAYVNGKGRQLESRLGSLMSPCLRRTIFRKENQDHADATCIIPGTLSIL